MIPLSNREVMYLAYSRRSPMNKFCVFIEEAEVEFFKNRNVKVLYHDKKPYIEVRVPWDYEFEYSKNVNVVIRLEPWENMLGSGNLAYMDSISYVERT